MNEILRRALFLPEQASTFSLAVDHLHYFVILTTFAASFLIGTAAIYFFVRWRRRRDDQPTPRITAGAGAEALIVLTPLAFFLTWWAIGFRDFARLATPPKDTTDIYVMGKQWMWKFSYPEGPNSLNALTVPAGRPVRLLLTSRDVIHSFFVPAFRIKQDAVPGRYTQTWFVATKPGRYPIYCAEYCGTQHSFMTGEVTVLAPEEYDRWLAERRRGLAVRADASDGAAPGAGALRFEGERVAVRKGCVQCHSLDGTRASGPTWAGLYRAERPLSTGARVVADEAYLTESMMRPEMKVVAGFPAVMPSFLGRLDPGEVAALLELIKSLAADGARRTAP